MHAERLTVMLPVQCLLKHEQHPSHLTYNGQKLLTIVTLVLPLILISLSSNIKLLWTNFDSSTDRLK